MTQPRTPRHHREHTLISTASADALYSLAADVRRWPAVFEPTVYVRLLEHGQLEHGEHTERFQIWATVGAGVRTWQSRRELDPRRRRIGFAQEHTTAPFTAMRGGWEFQSLPTGGTRIVLRHDFALTDDTPATLEWADRALDTNSEKELAALARIAELGHPVDELVFSFTDTVDTAAPAADAYDFVNRSDLWPQRLPHVGRVLLTEDEPGIQVMEMDTVTADGSAHTTRSVRVCTPGRRIVYKQLLPPKMLLGHSGRWEFTEHDGGTRIAAEHTVALNPAAVPELLGADATLADARNHIREALSRNSRSTLAHAAAAR